MIKKILLGIAGVAMCCLWAFAENVERVEVFDSIPANASTAIITVKAKPQNGKPCRWGMAWNIVDDNNYDVAMIELPDAKIADDAFPQPGRVVVSKVVDGVGNLVCSAFVNDVDSRSFGTLKLMFDGYGARLYAGGSKQQRISEVDFDASRATAVGIVADGVLQIGRKDVVCLAAPAVRHSRFADVDALGEYLAQSADLAEGVWQYLDRDIGESAKFGGRYALATVADGDGNYEVVYLAGAQINAERWTPLCVKGVLSPTIFEGNYDLSWQCADGRLLDDDNYAEISADGAILTLHFPTVKSQLRFRRADNFSLSSLIK